jgi:hypothetical protein
VAILLRSFRHWTGRKLITPAPSPEETARLLYQAPFAVVSHGTEPDPIFNYANLKAQELFELTWEEFVQLPSRESAETGNRSEREQLLERVARDGHVVDYRGIRISSRGKRFHIGNAVIWNLIDADGIFHGQAATFNEWRFL